MFTEYLRLLIKRECKEVARPQLCQPMASCDCADGDFHINSFQQRQHEIPLGEDERPVYQLGEHIEDFQ